MRDTRQNTQIRMATTNYTYGKEEPFTHYDSPPQQGLFPVQNYAGFQSDHISACTQPQAPQPQLLFQGPTPPSFPEFQQQNTSLDITHGQPQQQLQAQATHPQQQLQAPHPQQGYQQYHQHQPPPPSYNNVRGGYSNYSSSLDNHSHRVATALQQGRYFTRSAGNSAYHQQQNIQNHGNGYDGNHGAFGFGDQMSNAYGHGANYGGQNPNHQYSGHGHAGHAGHSHPIQLRYNPYARIQPAHAHALHHGHHQIHRQYAQQNGHGISERMMNGQSQYQRGHVNHHQHQNHHRVALAPSGTSSVGLGLGLDGDEDGQDDEINEKLIAYARFNRNTDRMKDVLSEVVMPDPRNVVTSARLDCLKEQVKALEEHLVQQEGELKKEENKWIDRKRKFENTTNEFRTEYTELCKPAATLRTYTKFFLKFYQYFKSETTQRNRWEKTLAWAHETAIVNSASVPFSSSPYTSPSTLADILGIKCAEEMEMAQKQNGLTNGYGLQQNNVAAIQNNGDTDDNLTSNLFM